MVVTPNEKAVIFIRSATGRHLKKVSKIFFCKLVRVGDFMTLDVCSNEVSLKNHIRDSTKCDVVIEEHNCSETRVRVLMAQSGGQFEVHDIALPT